MASQLEAVDGVVERLERTGWSWWLFSLLTGVALTVGLSVVFLALFVLVDFLLRLPQGVLGILYATWVTVTVVLGILLVRRTWRSRRSLAATARRVEMACPGMGSHLINVVQFAEEPHANPFYQAAADQAARSAGNFSFSGVARQESRWRRLLFCLQTPRDLLEAGGVLASILLLAWLPHYLSPGWFASFDRVLHPWAFIPATGSVRIERVSPGDTTVLAGANLEVAAEIDNPEQVPHPATLFVRRDGESETSLPMLPDESHQRYVVAVPQVLKPLQYRLEIGDTQTALYQVEVRQKPAIDNVEVIYHFPPYLGLPNRTVQQHHGDLEAPQFTRAHLRVRASVPIARGFIRVGDQELPGLIEEDHQTLFFSWLLERSTTYTIHLFDEAGHTDHDPRINRVEVAVDAAPQVELVQPPPESRLVAGSQSTFSVRASDDHGLGLVRIELKHEEAEGEKAPIETLASWTRFPLGSKAALEKPFVWDPTRFAAGNTFLVRAVARDLRSVDFRVPGKHIQLEPQEQATSWHRVHLLTREARAAETLPQLDAVRKALWQILNKQLQARMQTTRLAKQTSLDQAKPLAEVLRTEQVDIHKATVAVVAKIGDSTDAEQMLIKRVAQKLAFGDMLVAIKQAEKLRAVPEVKQLGGATSELLGTQDRIIDVLQRLLNEIRRESAERLAEMKNRPGGDLPNDVQDKLRNLQDKLDEFLAQQKKVIEASEDLAKKPVEDFSEEEEKLLEKLAAIEDDWSRFMADQHSDLSKLPEQDFANPSMLEELVEVQTELKMAKDALTRKAVDIAVPLEQLGAEMAKELTTNIEKWLPDTPDRERWSQEEPLTDEMKEAPMAELPGELEDLVGELMEEEEDLFDELEDASSSWADSLDKGAGWDAMDGPISNMSAKGVTGNRLPNTSEIGGRSGEGRQGKASGEFVADTAVGKGGRKTPSRLTPDPYVKGEVKDVSKDPVGGATGGGKQSGQGGEGLEGPVPPQPQKVLPRLTAKQAELRNKAESIDIKLKVMNYHRTDLNKLLEQMRAVEGDLRSGRYRNALRRREILLDGLRQVKTYLDGEFQMQQDRTVNLPGDVQKKILGSLQEASPSGWEELNRAYFERLSEVPKPKDKE
jgi:hypothetical protein